MRKVRHLAALAVQLIVKAEPAAAMQLLGAIATIVAVFGLDLDVEAALGLFLAVQTIVGLTVRAMVTSPATHADQLDASFRSGIRAGHASAAADVRLTRPGDGPPT